MAKTILKRLVYRHHISFCSSTDHLIDIFRLFSKIDIILVAMFEPVVERLYPLFVSLTYYADDHPKAFFSSCAVLIALVAYIPTILQDYRTYMAYGENGVPLTIRGWLLSTVFLRSLSSWDLLSTDMYKRNNDRRTWLDDDWPRKARESRPIMGSHPAPQRQLNQIPTEAAKTVRVVTLSKSSPPLLTTQISRS